jgi:pimeloyl-ACP methyl ester carboxylesterase
MILIAGGLTYQTVASARDFASFPAPGMLIDVGGYRLHLLAMGEPEDAPTVLLDAASGSAFAQWGWVQSALAESTRVIAFDRPGTGYSDAPLSPLSIEDFVQDLHQALQAANLHGPYLLVGHSMGSLTSRAFASAFPGDVQGILLLDPRYLDITMQQREVFLDATATTGEPTWLERFLPGIAARLGIMRMTGPLAQYVAQLPDESAHYARVILASTPHWDGYLEDALLGERAAATLASSETLGDTPLVILSAGMADADAFPEGARERFTAMHERMAATLSSRAFHCTLPDANHYTIVTKRDYAEQVTDVIRRMLEAEPPECSAG